MVVEDNVINLITNLFSRSLLDPLDNLQRIILKIIRVSEKNKILDIRQIYVINRIVLRYKKQKHKNEFVLKASNTRYKSLPWYFVKSHTKYWTKKLLLLCTKYCNLLPNSLKKLNVTEEFFF